MTTPCDRFEPLLTRYVLDDLDAATHTRVRDHISSCERCRAVLRDIQPTLGLLQSALAVPRKVPEHLSSERRNHVLDQIRRGRLLPWPKISWTNPRLVLVPVAAALIIFAVVTGFLTRSLAVRRPAESAELAVQLLPLPPPPATNAYALAKAGPKARQHAISPFQSTVSLSPARPGTDASRAQEAVIPAPSAPHPVVSPAAGPMQIAEAVDTQIQTETLKTMVYPDKENGLQTATRESIPSADSKYDIARRSTAESALMKAAVKTGKPVSAETTGTPPRPVTYHAKLEAAPPSAMRPAKSAAVSNPQTTTMARKQAAPPAAPAVEIQLAASKPASAAGSVADTSQAMTQWQGDGHEPTSVDYGIKRPDAAPFIRTRDNAVSPFTMNVDTSAYVSARICLLQGKLPPMDSVRTEAFINYFDYGYKAPEQGVFAITAEGAPHPFRHGLHLLKIGIKARSISGAEIRDWPNVVAAALRAKVEFNSLCVKRYRLLGYKDGRAAQNSVQPGMDTGGDAVIAGQSVTLLYELELAVPIKGAVGAIRLHYRDARSGRIEDLAQPIPAKAMLARVKDTNAAFRLAAAAAEFAELLQNSPFTGGNNTDNVARLLRPVAREMQNDARVQELLRFVQDAKTMPRGE